MEDLVTKVGALAVAILAALRVLNSPEDDGEASQHQGAHQRAVHNKIHHLQREYGN